ncbi:SGNH/GDSL hydrolase family protein [Leucothrix pacifica]|uniref:SGNH hydrolase-type esterase domain-containing protein n=1 Tax=Leucothrix pacifica TaxID=1247513 RepID=A0A317CMP6_9GAMM|nr:SGNH/GDSL hydrolase family protein [Leucothrix pacifica]PWQ99818.1 hypothetical protein DKW60_04910 [Leucothrix pacifica]
MKNITLTGFCLFTLLSLSGCVSESKNDANNNQYSNADGSSAAPTTVTGGSAAETPASSPSASTPVDTQPSETTPTETTPTPSTPSTPSSPVEPPDPVTEASWHRVYMHYGLLKGQPHEWGESGGYLSLRLAENAYEGAYSMRLDSTSGLLAKQLLTYRGSDNDYYTVTIQSISGNTVNLSTPLEKNVWYGESVWNFYENPSHPNYRGYQSIADYAVRSLGRGLLNYGTHALLGDSWFSTGTVRDRLQEKLSNTTMINLGIGGNTSFDLLSRFDRDVPQHNPDFVWVMTGTNDYWNYISTAQYKQNIRELISKIEALGAKPIIISPSVGPLNYGSSELTELSRAYTDAIEQLQNGY